MYLPRPGNLLAGDSETKYLPQVTGAGSWRQLRDNICAYPSKVTCQLETQGIYTSPQVTGAGSYRKLRDNVSYVLTPGNLPAGDSETPILAVSPNANSLKRA